jgi:NADH-quinone oxidoreductase subunit E
VTDLEPIKLAEAIEKQVRDASLISVMEDIQSRYRYLPRDALILLSDRLGVPLSRTYSVATFYHAFSLKPRGRFLIRVCLGTACHVRASQRVLEKAQKILKVKPGETTPDGLFTLETVNCMGACALGPIMVIENEYFGQMSPTKVAAAVEKYTHLTDQGEAA